MKSLSDKQLLEQIQQGNRKAMGEFYHRMAPYLTAVCRRYVSKSEDVKDVLQDSFVKMFTSIGRFQLKEEGSLKAWATRTVVNHSLNFLRNRHHLEFVDERMADDIPDDEMRGRSFSAEQLQQAIEQLPTGYRTVFNLFAVEGYSHGEIARMLKISPSTSASQFLRAKALLKKTLLKEK